jgi:hypothetical protein
MGPTINFWSFKSYEQIGLREEKNSSEKVPNSSQGVLVENMERESLEDS